MDLPTFSRPRRAHSTTLGLQFAHARRWRCASILLAVAAISCAGDEFEAGTGEGGAGATSGSSTTTSSGDGGSNPGTTTSSTVTSGEGGSAVSTGEGGGGGGGGENEGGGGSGPVGDCDPELSGELPIPAGCGVFVDPNRPEGEVGTGSKDDPFRSINDAVAAVAERDERRIYVSESVTDEHVVVTVEGVEMHGGLSNQWVYRPEGRTHVRQAADDPEPWAWEIASVPSDVTLRGFRIEGRAASTPGGSSIGLAVRQAFVRLERVEVIANDAMAGVDGTTPTTDIGVIEGLYDPQLAGEVGNAPSNMSQTLGGSGGFGGVNTRPGCSSQGGRGGTGASGGASALPNYEAGDGVRGTSDGSMTGIAGSGASNLDGVFTDCTSGQAGEPGDPGGVGTNAFESGTLSADDGYVPPTATAGSRGLVGDAGGGGGGGRRQVAYDYRGYGGNGGGAGGCGGFGGNPATSGGSSIAIFALDSTIYFESSVTLSAGAGGDGGDGALGQPGAKGGGGFLDPGDSLACAGGAGRPGGMGGPGGAGAGGHSIGVAHDGTQVLGDALFSLGSPGLPGLSAISEADGSPPAAGTAHEVRAF